MIVHETINMDNRPISLSCGFKVGQKPFPVARAFENCLSFIPP